MTRQLYVAVIIEYKNETMEYLSRLQACLVRCWRWVTEPDLPLHSS